MRLCEREKKKLKPEAEAHSRQQPPTSRLRCAAELLRLAAPLPLAPHPPTASADRYARSRNSSSLLVVGGQKVRSKECAGSVGKYKALSSSSRRGNFLHESCAVTSVCENEGKMRTRRRVYSLYCLIAYTILNVITLMEHRYEHRRADLHLCGV